MSFAEKHKRVAGNFISKKNAYKIFGSDHVYRLKNIIFRTDKFTTSGEEVPHLITYIDEDFSYEDDNDKIRNCSAGDYMIKTSVDMVDDCTDIIGDPDSMADIQKGIVGFRIYKYENTNLNKMCYGIEWVDLDEDGEPIEVDSEV